MGLENPELPDQVEQSINKGGEAGAMPLDEKFIGDVKQFLESHPDFNRSNKVIWGELSEKQTDQIVKQTPTDSNWHKSDTNGADVWACRTQHGSDYIINKPNDTTLPKWLKPEGKLEIRNPDGKTSTIKFDPSSEIKTNPDGSFVITDKVNGKTIKGNPNGEVQERRSDGTVVNHFHGLISTWHPVDIPQANGGTLPGYVLTESDGNVVRVQPNENGKYTIEGVKGLGTRFPEGFKYNLGPFVQGFKIGDNGHLQFINSEGDPSDFRPTLGIYHYENANGLSITHYPDGSISRF